MRIRPCLVLVGLVGISGCFEDTQEPTTTQAATTTTTSMSTSTGPADSSGGESTGAVDACPEYCGLIQDLCVDPRQYQSEELCLGVCAALPPGEPDDQLGNSANCRRFQAVQAAESLDFCGPAGPTGDGVCGAACEVFCGLAQELCVDGNAQWPDVPSCLVDCMQFPTDVEYSANVVDGDSYACRMYHLTVASLDPEVHCPHIPLDSPPCS